MLKSDGIVSGPWSFDVVFEVMLLFDRNFFLLVDDLGTLVISLKALDFLLLGLPVAAASVAALSLGAGVGLLMSTPGCAGSLAKGFVRVLTPDLESW